MFSCVCMCMERPVVSHRTHSSVTALFLQTVPVIGQGLADLMKLAGQGTLEIYLSSPS